MCRALVWHAVSLADHVSLVAEPLFTLYRRDGALDQRLGLQRISGGFQLVGYPFIAGWFHGKSHLEMDDWMGYPLVFRKAPDVEKNPVENPGSVENHRMIHENPAWMQRSLHKIICHLFHRGATSNSWPIGSWTWKWETTPKQNQRPVLERLCFQCFARSHSLCIDVCLFPFFWVETTSRSSGLDWNTGYHDLWRNPRSIIGNFPRVQCGMLWI